MPDDRMRRIEELFEAAAALEGESRREFLQDACGGDASLREELESLLSADEGAGDFMERPVADHGVDLAALRRSPGAEGQIVGNYKLLRKIGEGGMSEVYLAVRADDAYQKRVALKVIKHELDREDTLRRFRTERQILAGLDHPNIARLFDGGSTDDGLPYYVMEYIDGVPIDEYCDANRLKVAERLELFGTVCAAVQYAHQNLVIHRDIKSSNILVTTDGTPKLLDFGIAKLLKPDQFAQQVEYTGTWARPMTPRYASPEQIQGKPVATTSDVYSLGVLLYRLLTGRLPYRAEGEGPPDLGRLVVEQPPERPSTSISRIETGPSLLTPDADVTPEAVSQARGSQPQQLQRLLSGDLDNIVLMALRKEPQRRYGSAEQLAEDLRRYMRGLPVNARPDTFRYRSAKFVRRNRIGVGVAAVIVALLAGFAITMAVQAGRLARERDQVRLERDRAEQVVSFLKEIFAFSDPLSATKEDVSAREILDRGAARVRDELAAQPEVQASLMDAIGGVYRNLGLYDAGRPLLEQALETLRRTRGDRSPEVADTLMQLGVLERLSGDVERGEELLREALETRRSLSPVDDPALAPFLNHLGVALRWKGEFEHAEALYRESIRILEATGVESKDLATAQNNLATLLINTGRVVEAEPIFRDTLEMRRRLLGSNHPLIAQNLSNLGASLGMQGKFEEAEPHLREALDLYRELLDPQHPSMVESLNNMGKLMQRKGDPRAAIPFYEEALEIEHERTVGDPRAAHLLSNMGDAHRDLGDLARAEEYQRKALELRRATHGDDHPDVARSLTAIAQLVTESGRPAEGEPLARRAVEILEQALPDHWWTVRARSVLGGTLAGMGRLDEAEPLLLSAHDALSARPGPAHPAAQASRARLIELYEARGMPEKAAALRAP